MPRASVRDRSYGLLNAVVVVLSGGGGALESELVHLHSEGSGEPLRSCLSRMGALELPGAERVDGHTDPGGDCGLSEDGGGELSPLLADLTDAAHGAQLRDSWDKLRVGYLPIRPGFDRILGQVMSWQLAVAVRMAPELGGRW